MADDTSYVELASEDGSERVLHLLRADWLRWGKPETIEQFHANRKAAEELDEADAE